MSWKKFFSEVPVAGASDGTYSAMGGGITGKPGPARSNYSSYLPDVYSGAPNRIERYGQYNVMDMDSEVNAALDILAEFCTQNNEKTNQAKWNNKLVLAQPSMNREECNNKVDHHLVQSQKEKVKKALIKLNLIK